jgi:hypothetical protein
LETTAVAWQPVSPAAKANRAETDVSPTSTRVRHSALLADVRPTSSPGSTSHQGSQPVATLLYTLTAPMARFWPKTLPTSDDSSHCLDSGAAPEDLLGKVDAANATNISELSSPVILGTTSSSVPLTLTQGGCCSIQRTLLLRIFSSWLHEYNSGLPQQTCSSRVGLFRHR